MEQEKPSVFGKQIKLVAGFAALGGVIWFILEIKDILPPFVLAFVLSYVLAPLVDRLEGRGMNRVFSILIIFILVFSGLLLGSFKAGTKLTAEMLDLSEQFLVQEAVEREITIANKSSGVITIKTVNGLDLNPAAFFLVDPPDFPLVLDPQQQQTLKIRFAPTNTVPVEDTLGFFSSALPQSFQLRVRGNFSLLTEEANDYPFWGEGIYKDSIQVQALVFSERGIDFGRAGPSIITRLSDEVKKIQLMVLPQSGMGQDFNIANLIREKGGVLAEKLLGGTSEVLGGVFSGITFVVIVPFVAFFLLKEGKRITHSLIELVPNAYFELCLNLLHQINGQIGGYIRGLILATTIVGTLSVSGLMFIGLPYALPVGLIAGVANMIPFLGPLIGILSSSIVALATGGGIGMVWHVLIIFVIIQLIDNVLIQPIVLAKSVDLHPLVVLFVVLVGGQLMGLMGMLIAVPMTGIIKVSGQAILQGVKRYRTQ